MPLSFLADFREYLRSRRRARDASRRLELLEEAEALERRIKVATLRIIGSRVPWDTCSRWEGRNCAYVRKREAQARQEQRFYSRERRRGERRLAIVTKALSRLRLDRPYL